MSLEKTPQAVDLNWTELSSDNYRPRRRYGSWDDYWTDDWNPYYNTKKHMKFKVDVEVHEEEGQCPKQT